MKNLCVPRHMTWPAHDLLCWQLSRCVILGTASIWVRWHIPVPCATIMASSDQNNNHDYAQLPVRIKRYIWVQIIC